MQTHRVLGAMHRSRDYLCIAVLGASNGRGKVTQVVLVRVAFFGREPSYLALVSHMVRGYFWSPSRHFSTRKRDPTLDANIPSFGCDAQSARLSLHRGAWGV